MYAIVPRMTAAILWTVLGRERCAAQSWDHILLYLLLSLSAWRWRAEQ